MIISSHFHRCFFVIRGLLVVVWGMLFSEHWYCENVISEGYFPPISGEVCYCSIVWWSLVLLQSEKMIVISERMFPRSDEVWEIFRSIREAGFLPYLLVVRDPNGPLSDCEGLEPIHCQPEKVHIDELKTLAYRYIDFWETVIKLSKNSDFHHYLCSGVGGIWRGRDGRSSSTGASMFGAVRVLRSLKSCARPRKGKYNDYKHCLWCWSTLLQLGWHFCAIAGCDVEGCRR